MGDNFENISKSNIVNRSRLNQKDGKKLDPWYKKPLGLIVIGFIVTVLGYLFKYLVL